MCKISLCSDGRRHLSLNQELGSDLLLNTVEIIVLLFHVSVCVPKVEIFLTLNFLGFVCGQVLRSCCSFFAFCQSQLMLLDFPASSLLFVS